MAIVAGEASGDQHGAKLVSAMRKKYPALFFCGVGGDALRRVGVRIPHFFGIIFSLNFILPDDMFHIF